MEHGSGVPRQLGRPKAQWSISLKIYSLPTSSYPRRYSMTTELSGGCPAVRLAGVYEILSGH